MNKFAFVTSKNPDAFLKSFSSLPIGATFVYSEYPYVDSVNRPMEEAVYVKINNDKKGINAVKIEGGGRFSFADFNRDIAWYFIEVELNIEAEIKQPF